MQELLEGWCARLAGDGAVAQSMFSSDGGEPNAAPFADLRLPDSLRAPVIAAARKVRSGNAHNINWVISLFGSTSVRKVYYLWSAAPPTPASWSSRRGSNGLSWTGHTFLAARNVHP